MKSKLQIGDKVKILRKTALYKKTGEISDIRPAGISRIASYQVTLDDSNRRVWVNDSDVEVLQPATEGVVGAVKKLLNKFDIGINVSTPDGPGVIIDIHEGKALVHLTKDFINEGAPNPYGVKDLELLETATYINKLMEGNYRGDLKRLVKPELHIDQHRSKMGEDDDIIVVSFKVTGKEPAQDLVSFIETGYDFILDADASPGEISPGDFLVFFELSRRTSAPERIYRIVEEVLNLTLQKMDEWVFTYGAPEKRGTRTRFEKHPLTIENLKDIIPMSPREYRDTREEIESQDDDEIAAMKNIAQIPVNQEAPKDEEMDSLRQQAGLL